MCLLLYVPYHKTDKISFKKLRIWIYKIIQGFVLFYINIFSYFQFPIPSL